MPAIKLELSSQRTVDLDALDVDQAVEMITQHRASGTWLRVGRSGEERVDPHAVVVIQPAASLAYGST